MLESIFKNFNKNQSESDYHRLDKASLEKLYEKINDYFENYEIYGLQLRDGQINMALSVFDAIESSDDLVIEAGVGIGKSYAYLIPLLYYFSLTNKSFIISTSTIALQEQLEKDIKKLSEQLDIKLDLVVAKGMNNFICLNRLESFLNKSHKIKTFNYEKQDRKDYPDIKDEDWRKINVEHCLYSKCKNFNNCEFYKRRLLMKNINGVIICNHDLLIEDLTRGSGLYGRQLFKNVDFIVVDEAHNLESKVRSSKTKEIKINSIKEPIKNAIRILEQNKNYEYNYDKIIAIIEKLSNYINKNVLDKIKELKDNNIEIEDCNGLEFKFDENVIKLSNKVAAILNELNNSVQLYSNKDTEDLEEQLYDYSSMFQILSLGDKGNYLFWIERKNKNNIIYYAPKNIDEICYNLFFVKDYLAEKILKTKKKTFIFTSATLSTGKEDFSYFLQNIGANKVEKGLTVENSYDSPYDYDNNALLYSCSDIANPKDKNKYLEQLVEKIKELILLTHGKALVLFTSKSDMKYVYQKIGKKINDINIYVQNDGSSQDLVKNKFKKDINSVLFSTGIFWEGIDIKGKSLSNLIIARLPFPVVDPIMEYKKSLYGNKGFEKVYIPEMLIKLKQGVGRLIRSENDTGIVCILDSRLSKYEKVVQNTLPIKNIVKNIDDLKQFINEKGINN